MKKTLLALAAALIAVPAIVGSTAAANATSGPTFKIKFQTDFPINVPVGSFSNCSGTTFQCSGIANATVRANWGAYPSGWPDTCAGKNADVCAPGSIGADYEPQSTVWISNHDMYIKETPSAMAAVVPLQALNMTYGEFTERFRVISAPKGYKSAHLIVPNTASPGYYETDYPEGDWNGTFYVYQHGANGGNAATFKGTTFSAWHTTTIEWYPGHMIFWLDGKIIGQTTANVMSSPGIWVWQNENSTDGEVAPSGSTAEMEVSNAAIYSYTG
jgi:hypothetical protein